MRITARQEVKGDDRSKHALEGLRPASSLELDVGRRRCGHTEKRTICGFVAVFLFLPANPIPVSKRIVSKG